MNRLNTLSRRRFVRTAAIGAAALSTARLDASPLGLPIGCQTYPVRDAIGKDFDGTLKELASIGYRAIEMCSPPGYGGGYAPLVSMKASELKKHIHDAGLACESCHYTAKEFRESLPERIAYAKELGLKQMVLSSFGISRNPAMSDWLRAAAELNKFAEQIHKAGLVTGFHNHDGEFAKLDGVLIYDKLMSELDPKLVKMQFQVSVVRLGYEAATFFEKYPGRFCSIHLQDWSKESNRSVAVGQGSVDWKKLFAAAKKGGVKNYYVELSLDQMKASYPYLHGLKV